MRWQSHSQCTRQHQYTTDYHAPETTSPTRKRELVVLFKVQDMWTMQLSHPTQEPHKLKLGASSISTQDEEETELHTDFKQLTGSDDQRHRSNKSTSLLAASMRSLHLVKAKLQAKLHAAVATGRRPARAFSCSSAADRAHYCSNSRRKRSASVGGRVFRSRSADRPLSPSTSMIFIDCP